MLVLKLQMNNNYKENLIPKYFLDIIFPSISINLQISQIKALLEVKYNFNYYLNLLFHSINLFLFLQY